MKKALVLFSIICFGLTTYAQEKEIEVSAKILKTYVGKYQLAPNVIADVTTDEKHIFLQLTGQQKFEFIAVEKHTFYFKGLDVKVVFTPNIKGKIESLTIYQSGQTVTAKKIVGKPEKEIEVSAKTLKTNVGQENRNLVFDSIDLKIIERADSILSDSTVWNKQDDRKCEDDITNGSYSLFCALYKSSIDITGEYLHRRPGMQIVRFTLEKYENGRVVSHRLMDWNNHPDTTFEEVKKVLKESIDEIKKQLNKSSHQALDITTDVDVSEAVLQTYVGKYEVAPNVIADVTTDEKHIFLQLTGQQKFEFIAIEKHTFYFKGLDVKVVFNPNKKGKIESLTIYQNGQTVTAKKIEQQ